MNSLTQLAARISGDYPAIAAALEQQADGVEATLRQVHGDMAEHLKVPGRSGFTATSHVERWWFQLGVLLARLEQPGAPANSTSDWWHIPGGQP